MLNTNFPAIVYSQTLQTAVFNTPGLFDIAKSINMHNVIMLALDKGFSPACMQSLVSEYPHTSQSDAGMITYYQNADKMQRRIPTKAKPGKYIKRHFPAMSDSDIREFASLCEPATIEYLRDSAMVRFMDGEAYSVDLESCMAKEKGHFSIHPYSVYQGMYGWRLAVYKKDGAIYGRALVNSDSMEFVRTYCTDKSNGYNQDSEPFAAALRAAGYERKSGWKLGSKIARIETRNGDLVAPYIDGCNDNLDDAGGYMVIVRCGDYCADNTCGTLESRHMATCDDCGDRYDNENEGSYIDSRDASVCDSCASNYVYLDYRAACGRYISGMYSDEDVQTVNGESFDPDYPPENVCQDVDGDWQDIDNCVYVDCVGEYYPCDDSRIVYAYTSNGDQEYMLREDCFKCSDAGEYYDSQAYDSETVDGETYESNNLRAIREETQETMPF